MLCFYHINNPFNLYYFTTCIAGLPAGAEPAMKCMFNATPIPKATQRFLWDLFQFHLPLCLNFSIWNILFLLSPSSSPKWFFSLGNPIFKNKGWHFVLLGGFTTESQTHHDWRIWMADTWNVIGRSAISWQTSANFTYLTSANFSSLARPNDSNTGGMSVFHNMLQES